MTLFQRISNFIENADRFSIERMRIAAIVVGVFVFGFALWSAMFASDAPMAMLAATQPSAVRSAVPMASAVESTAVSFPASEERRGGDIEEEVAADEEDASEAAPADVSAFEPVADVTAETYDDAVPAQHESASADAPTLSAAAYIVARGGMPMEIFYEKNSRARRAPASLTKLMTAVVVIERIPEDEEITITERAVATEGVAGRVRAGERFYAGDLMKMMLIVSSNDAAAAFADHFSGKGDDLMMRMNDKARELGMNDTHFANPTGLDTEDHYSTAFDLALLASYVLRYDAIWDALSEKSDTVYALDDNTAHRLVSNNPIVQKGAAGVKGSKTGFTDHAGGCMITALDDGTVTVVLGAKDRAKDTEALIALVQNNQ